MVLAASLLLSFVLASLFAPAASAHRLNMTTTELVWVPDSRSLEITHSLHLDDGLNLLAALDNADGVLDLKAVARLMNYLNANFELATGAARLELEPHGAEFDAGVLYLYQEAKLDTLPVALEVRNSLLHGLQNRQANPVQNQLNWRAGSIVRSLLGSPEQPLGWLQLNQPTPANNRAERSPRDSQ